MKQAINSLVMSLATFIRPKPAPQPKIVHIMRPEGSVKARYDAAITDDENKRHWALADSLDANSSNNLFVRSILRNRARYEFGSNSLCWGMLCTMANDVIRTGPRLQVLENNETLNEEIEEVFQNWAEEIGFAKKLRVSELAEYRDGEVFWVFFTNPRLKGPIKLDIMLFEADRVTSDYSEYAHENDRYIDGIQLDQFYNPLWYKVRKHHPGNGATYDDASVTFPSEYVVHCFDPKRPEQHRGIPEIMPALPLFAQMRRFTLATLSAAEHAANFAGVMYTDLPPKMQATQLKPKQAMEVFRGMFPAAPAGWKIEQIDAKHPNAMFSEFRDAIMSEFSRCIAMPKNIAKGDSSGYNYASGRLDNQNYDSRIFVKRHVIETDRLRRVFNFFIREYALINPKVARIERYRREGTIKKCWFWDRREHVDPLKEAVATEKLIKMKLTTYSDYYGSKGKDWRKQFKQAAIEKAQMKKDGITPADLAAKNVINLVKILEEQIKKAS